MDGRRIHLVMAMLIASLAFTGSAQVTAAVDPVVVAGIPNPTTIDQVSAVVQHVEVDSAGNIYFAVPYHPSYGARLWKAAPSGELSVIAGTGVYGFSGDGGPATAAQVGGIRAINVDSAGNVYFADEVRIRRIDAATNNISTIAGSGTWGVDGDGGPATAAQLTNIDDIGIDSVGNVYLAGSGFVSAVRRVDASTGIISTIATGNPFGGSCSSLVGPVASADYSYSSGLAIDSTDTLYLGVVCSTGGARILKVTPAGNSTVFAGGGVNTPGDGGPATAAVINVSGLDVGPGDTIRFGQNSAIRQVTQAGILSTITPSATPFDNRFAVLPSGDMVAVGSGGIASVSGATVTPLTAPLGEPANGAPATSTLLGGLISLAVDANGALYYSTASSPNVRSIDSSGLLGTAIGDGTYGTPVYDGPATSSPFFPRTTLHGGVDGRLYAAINGDVARVDDDGTLRQHLDGNDSGVRAFAITSTPDRVFALGSATTYDPVSGYTPTVLGIDGTGGVTTVWESAGFGAYYTDLAASPDGTLLLAPGTGATMLRLDPGTSATTPIPFAPGFNGDTQVAVDAGGNIFVVTPAGLSKIDPSGTASLIDEVPALDVAVDAAGDVYVMQADAILAYTGLGIAQSVTAGDDSATVPFGVATAIDVTANDSATSGGLTTPSVTTDPLHGSVAVTSASEITYTPANGYTGPDSFGYEVCAALADNICDTAVVTVSVGAASQGPAWPDFDGDGSADRSVFRPEFGGWFADGQTTAFLGLSGDVPVPADYDGDGVTERAVYRDGAWFVEGEATRFLGTPTDVPVPGDYDGDGDGEPAVFRDGAWFIDGQPTQYLGAAGDVPVPGDYDGDGTTEIGVFRPSVGGWYVEGAAPVFYGLGTDVPVPADYNGDGSTDRSVFRPEFGGWYVDGLATEFIGLSSDVPVPADYDGDGTAERAVFRPEFGGWYVQDEATVFYGLGTDIPLPLPAAIHTTYYG